MSSQQQEKSTRCNGNLDCPASLTHWSNCLSRYRGTEFGKWWATKKAEGYDYGYEALENVQFGFEAGASSLAEKQEEIEKLRIALKGVDNCAQPNSRRRSRCRRS